MAEHIQDPSCYPGTNVLINKFNIKVAEKLNEVERNATAARLAQLRVNPIKGNFDFEHLKKIHKHIFQDVYALAGQVRTGNIAKHDLFCLVQHIESYQKPIFIKLRNDNYLIGLSRDDFARKSAGFLGDINALHPFREGNGRAQQEFMRELALNAGYKLDLTSIPREQMILASRESMVRKNGRLENIVKENLKPVDREQIKDPYDLKGITDTLKKIAEWIANRPGHHRGFVLWPRAAGRKMNFRRSYFL